MSVEFPTKLGIVILPANAVADVLKIAPKMPETQLIMVNLSGRGDKDMRIISRELDLGDGAPVHAENRGTW